MTILDIEKRFDELNEMDALTYTESDAERVKQFLREAIREAMEAVKPNKKQLHQSSFCPCIDEKCSWKVLGFNNAIDKLEENIKQFLEGE